MEGGGRERLNNCRRYDTDEGQIFKWVPFHDAKHPTDWYFLECEELKLNYVTSKLRMTDSVGMSYFIL